MVVASDNRKRIKDQVLGDRYQVQQQLGKKTGRRTLLAGDVQTQELVVVKLLSFGSDVDTQILTLTERRSFYGSSS